MIQLEAEQDMLIDGKVLADGSGATQAGLGGGSGGSVYLKARHFSGLFTVILYNIKNKQKFNAYIRFKLVTYFVLCHIS